MDGNKNTTNENGNAQPKSRLQQSHHDVFGLLSAMSFSEQLANFQRRNNGNTRNDHYHNRGKWRQIAMDGGNHGEVVHNGATTTNGIPRMGRRRHQEGALRSGMRCDDDWQIHRTIVHPIQQVWPM